MYSLEYALLSVSSIASTSDKEVFMHEELDKDDEGVNTLNSY